jgi:hypothetical protein
MNRITVGMMIFIVGVVMVAMLGAYFLDWFSTPLELTSPDNLQRLSRQANDAWQALEAKQQTIINLEQQADLMVAAYGDDQSTWPQGKRDEYLQLMAQVTNLKASYNVQCGQYNAFWDDEWRGIPAPNDIPTSCQFLN